MAGPSCAAAPYGSIPSIPATEETLEGVIMKPKRDQRDTTETHRTAARGGRAGQRKTTEEDPEKLRERIAKRAYELYLERGAADHHALDDWLEAERQILGNRNGRQMDAT